MSIDDLPREFELLVEASCEDPSVLNDCKALLGLPILDSMVGSESHLVRAAVLRRFLLAVADRIIARATADAECLPIKGAVAYIGLRPSAGKPMERRQKTTASILGETQQVVRKNKEKLAIKPLVNATLEFLGDEDAKRKFERDTKTYLQSLSSRQHSSASLSQNQTESAGIPTPVPNSSSQLLLRGHRFRTRQIAAVLACLLVVLGLSLYLTVGTSPSAASHTASDATAIEQRYDGMDPTGKTRPGTTCTDAAHPSQPVTQVHPRVVGPQGKVVGYIELRTSPICQVIWARVYWLQGSYAMPLGWSLHIEMHRNIHSKTVEYISHDTSNYVYGSMLATVSGCAYASVFFTNGSRQTPAAITPCLTG